jgi:CarD family transcriptional regulator
MASKPVPAKNHKKPATKSAAKPSKSPAKKSPARPATGKTSKPAPKAAAKPAPKAAAKPVAAKPAAKAASKPAVKATAPKASNSPAAAKGAAIKAAKPTANKPTAKETPKKKLNVGQKPRTDRADLPLKPATFITTPRESDQAASAPKPSPASKEAKQTFKVNDSIVYPAHGVGRVAAIEKQQIAGIANELFVIEFEQEKLRLKVPTAKAISVGMRGLSDEAQVKKALDLLKGRARIKRTMWSRRAQEYEAKINSGDILAVAEVVRDLYRATDQPEQSYSERQLFEAAQDRLAREVAAVRKCDLAKALADLDASLQQKKAA